MKHIQSDLSYISPAISAITLASSMTRLLLRRITVGSRIRMRPADDDMPNAGTITKMGDWLLNNLPAIGEALGTVFALPAIGRVVGKAGDAAVKWVQQRFGKQ
jgi:hypothetical protein